MLAEGRYETSLRCIGVKQVVDDGTLTIAVAMSGEAVVPAYRLGAGLRVREETFDKNFPRWSGYILCK